MFHLIVSVDSVRVRSGAGRGDGEPLRQRTASGRRVSQPIRGDQSRFRRDASSLGEFAAPGAVGRGGPLRFGRSSSAAAVQAHLGGQLPSQTPVEKGDSFLLLLLLLLKIVDGQDICPNPREVSLTYARKSTWI